MMYENLQRLKQKLETIKFGILKTNGAALMKLSQSFIIDTCRVDYDGYLWCSCTAAVPSALKGTKGFAVQLKYVHKAEALFIKISGHAKLVSDKFPCEGIEADTDLIEQNENKVLLKIKIEEVHYYKKKHLSTYTSFLQAINYFSLHRTVLNKGA